MSKRLCLGVRGGILATVCLFGIGSLLAGALGPAPLPDGTAATSSSSTAVTTASNAKDDFDEMLDMDLKSLSQVKVQTGTMTDPIVEAVSRKPETMAKSPGVVEVITAEEIRDFGAKTLREVLVRGTSIWMPNSEAFPNNIISMRGDLPGHYDTHVLLLLNGRPFKDTLQGGMNHPIYTAFPIESLARIEIIRGPGSVLYGTNAYVGVINLITKDPLKGPDSVSVLAGTLSTQRYEITKGSGTKCKNLFVGAMYLNDTGYYYAAIDELGAFNSKHFSQHNLGVVGVYENGPFTLNAFAAKADETMLGNTLTHWRDDGFLTSTRIFCDLAYTIGDPDDQSLETHFTYNYNDSSFWGVPPYLVPEHLVSHDYLIEPIYRNALTEKLSLMIGGTIEFREGYSRLPTVPVYDKIWYTAYAQFDYEVTDWLILVGGMQGNMPGTIKGGIVPRVGLIISLNDHWTLKTLYGSAFRSPAAIETDIDVAAIRGNPNLEPETIDTWETQLAYNDETKRLAVTYFHSGYSNLISRDATQVPPTYANLGGQQVQGVELEARARLSQRFRFVGSTTWQENHNSKGVYNATLVPNWMVKTGLVYETQSHLKIGVFNSYFSAPASVTVINPGAAIVNPVPGDCNLLSVNASFDLSRYLGWRHQTFEAQFLIQNVLGEEVWYPEFSRYRINSVPAGAGRTFYGGFTLAY
ncbi:MAG: TonB-dependent receptor [Pirellulales bacterium]|nr:TonB-dependent receptor [Pirellulales bacterium]